MEFVTWARKIILYTEYVSGKVVISNAEPGWFTPKPFVFTFAY